MAKQNDQFSFEISLSVLNHLGRNLYRSFMTVLGEAISNAWDADAENVWIYINKEKNSLVIKDDGDGMDKDDFQGKFLKIGYSKRKSGSTFTKKGRPFIGRKGIGKLALLSCAEKISVLSKTSDSKYTGGSIDNSDLEQAITDDKTTNQYLLDNVDNIPFEKYKDGHTKGTIIYFENIHDGIKNTTEYLKKLIALYFRFSLLDESFNIFLDDEKITYDDLSDFANKTQFVWNINNLEDPYVTEKLPNSPNLYKSLSLNIESTMKGFVASVDKPSSLKIPTTDEKVSIDLFVNGRLREKDILKHISSTRWVESYLYGQIHFNELDDATDRFASSREGIVAGDEKYDALLNDLKKKIIARAMEDWGKLRDEILEDIDPDDPRYTKKEIKSRELFNIVSKEYSLPKKSGKKEKVDMWIGELADDARFNFASYAECFISENLVRKYIEDKKYSLTKEVKDEIDTRKKNESNSKNMGNISIDIRRSGGDLSYLSMDYLANLVDREDLIKNASLARDAKEYKPMRDALAHTALLTNQAKNKLTSVYENIKARVKALLSTP